MEGNGGILVISAPDGDTERTPSVVRRDGRPMASQRVDTANWMSALRSHDWDLVVCPPELLHDYSFERAQCDVLERMASGAPLAEQLERIVRLIEAQAPRMLCSILLLNRDTGTLHTGAAPNLPPEYVRAIDGEKIGPMCGSCGTAAYLGKRVIVEDIATHEFWVSYRHLALLHGLRASWSSPILSAKGDVLGTFAMYFRETRTPSPRELHWIDRATHLAAIAISRDLSEAALKRSETRYRQIVDTAYEGIWLLDSEHRVLFANARTSEMLGHPVQDIIGHSLFEFIDEADHARARRELSCQQPPSDRQIELCFRRRDAGQFWVIVSISPVRNDTGESIGTLGLITDITQMKRAEAALRKGEAEFRGIFENASMGIALVDTAGRLLRANPALKRILGCAEPELQTLDLSELLPTSERALQQGLDATVLGVGLVSERRYLRRDGTSVWVRVATSAVIFVADVPPFRIVLIDDVSDRKRMEDNIRSGERLRALVHNAVSDVIFYVGVEAEHQYRFLSINPAFSQSTGLGENAVVGHLLTEIIPAESIGQVLTYYAQAIRERRTVKWNEVSAYPAGTKYGEVSITPIFAPDGRCTNLVGTVHDITDHRHAEERLAAQAALLDQANDAILAWDARGGIQYWNQGAARLYGWSSQLARGREVADLLFEDRAKFQAAHEQLIQAGSWRGELLQRPKTGKPLLIEASWTLLRDESGAPKSVLAIHTDISEKRLLEMQISKAQRLEGLGTLAGGIAHDFNNVLMAIGGNVELALLDLDAAHPAREALSQIESASARGTELVRQILTFSRQEAPRRAIVDVTKIAIEVTNLVRASLPKNIELQLTVEHEVPNIVANVTQVHQVIMNLITNASHAMAERGGVLGVRVERRVLGSDLRTEPGVLGPGTYACVIVSDTGTGMDEAMQQRIFDPFFSTKGPSHGTGLGLAVVHGIVKKHDGGIVVRSVVGVGSEFEVFFPAAPSAPA